MPDPSPLPRVSVVMPVRNEAPHIKASLGALLAQDYPPERLEVLVVDGASDDGTPALVAELAAGSAVAVRVLHNPARIAPVAMNLGIAAASGEVIVRMDGHTVAAPDYVAQVVAALARTGADNVGGNMTAVARTTFGKAVAAATSSPFGVGNAKFHYSQVEEEVDTVYLGAWPRATFERFGGFDERFVRTQDSEFNYRTRAMGGRIVLCPAIRSTYYPRESWAKLRRQYYEYGYWKTRLMFKLGGKLLARHFVPPALVVALAGSALLLLHPLTAPLAGVVPGLYALGVLAASALLSWRARSPALLPHLVLVLPTLHLAWGLGFLVGLLVGPRELQTPERGPAVAASGG